MKIKFILFIIVSLLILNVNNAVNSESPNNIINKNNKQIVINDKYSKSNENSGSSSSNEIEPFISQYKANRNQLVQAENELKLGYNTPFNSQEEQANLIFMDILQNEELSLSNNDPSGFNFFIEKQIIENESTIYKILQQMPKGSVLHVHQDSSASYDYLIDIGTYLPNCYIYLTNEVNNSNNGTFYFFSNQPTDTNWVLLSTLRSNSKNVTELDLALLNSLTLVSEDYGDYVSLWRKFGGVFARVRGLVSYVPIALGYMNHLFEQMTLDNVQHVEMRKDISTFYDIQGNIYNGTWFMGMMEGLISDFQQKNNMPYFTAKIIGSSHRHISQSLALEEMKYCLELRNQFPRLFIGYDMVGPEDSGYSGFHFIDQFAEIIELGSQYQYPLDFYFHAGETILYNNTNLYDAILLNTKRIGHGLQLSKHPLLMDMVIKQNIGIEVCPISNQILQFVSNMRAHPALDLINRGLQVTISSDDPAIYGYNGVSFDFFELTYSFGLDLLQLKQIAINSIQQSATFDQSEADLLYNAWEAKWYNFIDYIISSYSN